jgi:predicted flap endonuclease-1-like 5' DNA nuclease
MSSFLWLLLYLAPLLGLTAAVFAWFGWQWRGRDLQQRIQELTTQIDAAQTALRHAEAEHAAAQSKAAATTATAEASVPSDSIAGEILTLRDDLKSAQTKARLHQDEAAKAHEAALALTSELEQLRAEHATAQAELSSLRSALPVAEMNVPAPAAPVPTAPAKRKRSTPAKAKESSAASITPLREKIAALESELVTHQRSLAVLTQEHDDWHRRISKLEARSPADPAGLGLARRSLADSEKRLVTATTEIERLENQTRVLLRVETAAAELADVPDDDLTQIKGIKDVISEQLRAHGIRTWKQIALWDDAEQRAFSELLAFKNRAAREQWQEQARALHEAAHGLLI